MDKFVFAGHLRDIQGWTEAFVKDPDYREARALLQARSIDPGRVYFVRAAHTGDALETGFVVTAEGDCFLVTKQATGFHLRRADQELEGGLGRLPQLATALSLYQNLSL